tara:strand:+ start:1240 stop:2529 length:1290 start_codon:yes stop_codon:yes gene_type:complete
MMANDGNEEMQQNDEDGEDIPLLMRANEIDSQLRLEQLMFDPINYRLLSVEGYDKQFPWDDFGDEEKQNWCKKALYDPEAGADGNRFEVREMVNQIQKNGITWQDRLLVAKWPSCDIPDEEAQYIVLEGNRRLRAFQEILSLHADGEDYHHLIIEGASNPRVVVKQYESAESLRKEAITAMSVRHLCGTKDWGPYENAMAKVHTYNSTVESIGEEEHAAAPRLAADQLGIRTRSLSEDVRTIGLIQDMGEDPDYGDRVKAKGLYSLAKACANNPTAREILGIESGDNHQLRTGTKFTTDETRSFFMRKKYGTRGDEGASRFYGEITGEAEIRIIKRIANAANNDPARNGEWKQKWLDEEISLIDADANCRSTPPSWKTNFRGIREDVIPQINVRSITSMEDLELVTSLRDALIQLAEDHRRLGVKIADD